MGKKRTAEDPVQVPAVGSKVRMRFGTADVVATVIEHRGPLGIGGRQMVRLRFQFPGAGDAIETEAPVDEVTPVGSAA